MDIALIKILVGCTSLWVNIVSGSTRTSERTPLAMFGTTLENTPSSGQAPTQSTTESADMYNDTHTLADDGNNTTPTNTDSIVTDDTHSVPNGTLASETTTDNIVVTDAQTQTGTDTDSETTSTRPFPDERVTDQEYEEDSPFPDFPDGMCHVTLIAGKIHPVFCDSSHYCCGKGARKKCCPNIPSGAIFGIVSSALVISILAACCVIGGCLWCDVCPYRRARLAKKASISSAMYNPGGNQQTDYAVKDETVTYLPDKSTVSINNEKPTELKQNVAETDIDTEEDKERNADQLTEVPLLVEDTTL